MAKKKDIKAEKNGKIEKVIGIILVILGLTAWYYSIFVKPPNDWIGALGYYVIPVILIYFGIQLISKRKIVFPKVGIGSFKS